MAIRNVLFLIFFAASFFANALPQDFAPAQPKLNLSVTLPEEREATLPNRAQRLFTLEKNSLHNEITKLDELDQDRLYMRLFKGVGKALEQDEKIAPVPFKKNAKTILFFDMNFGPSEIRAARLVAHARGENLIVVPERTEAQQDGIEKEYRDWVNLSKLWRDCYLAGQSNCDDLQKQMNETYERMQVWLNQIQKFEVSQLDQMFEKFEKEGVQLSAIVFSGHSGGNGYLSGFFGSIDAVSVKASFDKFPNALKTVTSILIWGCYSGTLESLTEYWQKVFPSVQGFIGYRNQAPLGIRESSGKLLKSYFENETALLTAATPKDTHQIFRTLTGVALLDSTAVFGEYYYAYDQVAKIKDLIEICDNFDESLLQTYQCYNDGKPGCENPPASHQGPLRTLYSFLQVNRHCLQRLNNKYFGVPTPDSLIRLIYIDQVKENFYEHYQSDFQSFADYANEVGMPSDMRLEKFYKSKRSEDMRLLGLGQNHLFSLGLRDFSSYERNEWMTISLLNRSLFSIYGILARDRGFTCTPWSWIEPDSKDQDSCGLREMLVRPISDSLRMELWALRYNDIHNRWLADHSPNLHWLYFGPLDNVTEVRTSLLSATKGAIDWLLQYADLSSIEKWRLSEYNSILLKIENMNDSDILKYAVDIVNQAKADAEKIKATASADPNGSLAVNYLDWTIYHYEEALKKLNLISM